LEDWPVGLPGTSGPLDPVGSDGEFDGSVGETGGLSVLLRGSLGPEGRSEGLFGCSVFSPSGFEVGALFPGVVLVGVV